MRTRQVEFAAPAGLVPEGTSVGEDFDVVCTMRLKPSGNVCLVKAGDIQMPGYDQKDKQVSGYGEYAQKLQSAGEQ